MEVNFPSDDDARRCSSMALLVQRWGVDAALQIAQRLTELDAVDDFTDLQSLLGRRFRRLDGRLSGCALLECDSGIALVVRQLAGPNGASGTGGSRIERVLVVSIGGGELKRSNSRR